MDKIIIKKLKLPVHIGLSEKERKRKQPVILDCELILDLKLAGNSDNIKDTINYSDVCEYILGASKKESKTLEHLAHILATGIKEKFKPSKVKLLIRKPRALKRFKTKYAAVEIIR